MRATVVLFLGCLSLLAGGEAFAKGEGGGLSAFCFGTDKLAANTIRFPEEAPNEIVVSTNFGLLVSRDAGETFGWVCPQMYGSQVAGNFTLFALPGVATLPDGTVFALSGGLGYWISSEDECRFESAPDDDLRAATVVSVAAREATPDVALVALSWPGRTPYGIYRSEDTGRTFEPTELSVDEDRLRFGSIHITPGGERAYVTTRVLEDSIVRVWHSDDGATGWVPAKAEMSAMSATIVASREGNPDELYLEVTRSITGACDFDIAVMRSDDAGETFEVVQEREEILVGVVVDSEGAVWMGWLDSGLEVWRDGVIEPVADSPAPIGCLVQAPSGGLAVCPLGDTSDDQVLVTVRDHETGVFTPLVTLGDVTAPLECAEDTPVARDCTERWDEVAAFWKLAGHSEPDGGPVDEDGGVPGSDSGPVGRDAGVDGGDGDDGGGDTCSCWIAGRSGRRGGQATGVELALMLGGVAMAGLLRGRARGRRTSQGLEGRRPR